jgi:MFS family permease
MAATTGSVDSSAAANGAVSGPRDATVPATARLDGWCRHATPIASGGGALLVVLCAVNFLDAMDVSSMGPTLPRIENALGMSPAGLQWVVSAYVLGYGGFLLLGGRMADLFSRRRLLLGSLVVFALASLVGGLANSGPLLIAARLVKGISAAFMAPAALAILLATWRDEEARDRALGRFISIAAAGFALGLVVGGALTGASWRLTMFLPSVIAVVLLAASRRVVPAEAPRSEPRGRVDAAGAVMVTAGLLAVVFGVSHASTSSWTDATTLVSLAAGIVLLLSFGPFEQRQREPLVPLGIFRRPELARANLNALFFQGIYVGFQFVATLYYQNVLGWTPLEAGLAFLLGGAIVLVAAPRFAARVAQFGPWPIVALGMALQTLGYLWFTRIGHIDSVVLVVVQQLLVGTGFAAVYPSLNIAAVRNARPEEQGLASGMFIAAVQIGSGIVLAVVASVFTSNAGAGLHAYHAGLWTVFGIAAAATLLAASGLLARNQTTTAPVVGTDSTV